LQQNSPKLAKLASIQRRQQRVSPQNSHKNSKFVKITSIIRMPLGHINFWCTQKYQIIKFNFFSQ